MNPSLFFTWASLFTSQTYLASCAQYNQDKYPALIVEIPFWDTYFDGTKNVSCFTFCPASTETEKKRNDQVSITGHSLFLKNLHGPKENITSNICDEPPKPTMVYNTESHQYEIGYELYYEEDRLKWKNGAYFWYGRDMPRKYQFGKSNYHVYRQVKNNNEVINNDGNKTILLNNGSSKWIFRWISAINIISSGDNKQIKIERRFLSHAVLQSKCDDCGLLGMDLKIYISSENSNNSEESQNQTLSSIKNLKPWYGKLYGSSLGLSQIAPFWYFSQNWAKAASCSHMNMIPVWNSIAVQLRRVDLYILAVGRKIPVYSANWDLRNAYFGTSGVLPYKNESEIGSNQSRKIYSSPDNAPDSHIIPVPKIIYRVIEAVHFDAWYAAIIVIHNDPNPISDRDRVCKKSEEVWGWEAIENDDPKTGITYVCPHTAAKIEHVKLGFQAKNDAIQELTLKSMVHCAWNDLNCKDYHDATSLINQEFEKLLNITADISF